MRKSRKFHPRLSFRQRKAIAGMNPVSVWAKVKGLSTTLDIARFFGVSPSFISDILHCRKANPTFLKTFAEKTGLELPFVLADYQRCYKAFQEMDDRARLHEIQDSNVFTVPAPPDNPMRILLDKIGATPEQLARQLKGAGAAAIQSVLDVKATYEKASQIFLAIAYEKPLYMTSAGINSCAEALYRRCLDHEERKAKAEENTQRANSWVRHTWIELSQPRAALVEPEE